jgi:acetyl-CoA C-acetyltransferase
LSTKAIVGATSKGLSGQVDAMFVAGPPPDAAIIMIGANDVTLLNGIPQSARRLGDAVKRLRASGAVVVVGTCPDFGIITAIPQPLRWSPATAGCGWPARRPARSGRPAGCRYPGRPADPGFRKAPTELFSADGYHPSGAGYALAAQQLLPALSHALGETSDTLPWLSKAAESRSLATRLRMLARIWPRRTTGVRRWSSSRLSDLHSVLERELTMPEAVIVSTARSPIGRAVKGSLASMRPDDLVAQMVRAASTRCRRWTPRHRRPDDGLRPAAGEAGYNIARAVAVELGYDFLPGTTVNRYCSSSLQTTRMAFHAIKAGEGDAFISAGVETVSRFGVGAADGAPNSKNALFDEAQARGPAGRRRRQWHDPREDGHIPDVYIAMGQTAENVVLHTGISREDQDHWGVRSQNRAEEAIKSGFFEREITPVTLPDGTVVSTDDGPRAGTTYESQPAQPCSAPTAPSRPATPARSTTAPPRGHHERRQGQGARPDPAGAHRLDRVGPVPEIMGLGPSRPSRRRWRTPACRSATSTCSRSTRRSPCRCWVRRARWAWTRTS